MEPVQSKTLVAMLVAAYPRESLEPASAEVYSAALMELGDADIAREAVGQIVRSSARLPSISEIREVYLALREREHRPDRELGWTREQPQPGTIPHAQTEAILRARERLDEAKTALGVVMIQWTELEKANVPVWMNPDHMEDVGPGVLNPKDRVAIRQLFPDWRPGSPLPAGA